MDRLPMVDLFAGELRRLRTEASLSQDELGQRIGYSASLVAAVEQCRRPPREEFAQRCDLALETGGLLGRIRASIVRESVLPWFREWVTIEQEATILRSFQPTILPGLLQTEAYARALYAGAARLYGADIEQPLAARMARQGVLTRERPPLFVAVFDQAALERPIGGGDVLREQLLHLLDVGERPRVQLQVVPAGTGAYPGLNGAFVIATPAEGGDVAYLDNALTGTVVERAADVHSLKETWECIRAEALPHGQTMKMISEAAERWI